MKFTHLEHEITLDPSTATFRVTGGALASVLTRTYTSKSGAQKAIAKALKDRETTIIGQTVVILEGSPTYGEGARACKVVVTAINKQAHRRSAGFTVQSDRGYAVLAYRVAPLEAFDQVAEYARAANERAKEEAALREANKVKDHAMNKAIPWITTEG